MERWRVREGTWAGSGAQCWGKPSLISQADWDAEWQFGRGIWGCHSFPVTRTWKLSPSHFPFLTLPPHRPIYMTNLHKAEIGVLDRALEGF